MHNLHQLDPEDVSPTHDNQVDSQVLQWWLCGLELAGGGLVAVVGEVTMIATLIEITGLTRTYDMPAQALLALALEPVSFHRCAPPVSAQLSRVAALAGVKPATVVAWHLAAECQLLGSSVVAGGVKR